MRVNISESHDKTIKKLMDETGINSPTHLLNVLMTHLKSDNTTMEAFKNYAQTRNKNQ